MTLRKSFDFIPHLIPNQKIFLFVTKCPWGFALSVTVRGNAFIAQQNRLSATARVFRTFAAQNPRTVWLIDRGPANPVLVGLKETTLSQPLDISQNRKFFNATYFAKKTEIV
mgnify:CR=1 FL=1